MSARGRPKGEALRSDFPKRPGRPVAADARPTIRAWRRSAGVADARMAAVRAGATLRQVSAPWGSSPVGSRSIEKAVSVESVTICEPWVGRQDPRIPTVRVISPVFGMQPYSMQRVALGSGVRNCVGRLPEELGRLEQRVPYPPEQRNSNQGPRQRHQSPVPGSPAIAWVFLAHDAILCTRLGCPPAREAGLIFGAGGLYAIVNLRRPPPICPAPAPALRRSCSTAPPPAAPPGCRRSPAPAGR